VFICGFMGFRDSSRFGRTAGEPAATITSSRGEGHQVEK
jgi:hypothetical protein